MKILLVNKFDQKGGAARAAYRLHNALREYGINSRMLVDIKSSDDWLVTDIRNKFHKGWKIIAPYIIRKGINLIFKSKTSVINSPSIFPSNVINYINNSDFDIVNLHWIQDEMISIEQISKIKKPIIWTLHDMWAFSGSEHYTYNHRWKEGYNKLNKPDDEFGFDLNRWCWKRKSKNWKRDINFVCPSRWLANCANQSALLKGKSIKCIPNPLDLNIWNPISQNIARDILNLPKDCPILLFGSMGGSDSYRKGFDLLKIVLKKLMKFKEIRNLNLLIFGQSKPEKNENLGFPIHYSGKFHDDISLKILYSAADLTIVPSRLDNLPQVACESIACGTPVASFNIGGLPDIIEHKVNGFLAKPFDTSELAYGVKWILEENIEDKLSFNARKLALQKFSSHSIAKKYKELFMKVLNSRNK